MKNFSLISNLFLGQVKLSVQQPHPLLAFSQISTTDATTSSVPTDTSIEKNTTVTSTQNSHNVTNYCKFFVSLLFFKHQNSLF